MAENSKGPAPVRVPVGSAASESAASAATGGPQDVATLMLEYRDGRPVIVVSGGPAVPAGIKMVDASGKPITVDTAAQPRNAYGSFRTGDSCIVLNTYKPRPDSDKLSYDVHFWLGTYISPCAGRNSAGSKHCLFTSLRLGPHLPPGLLRPRVRVARRGRALQARGCRRHGQVDLQDVRPARPAPFG